MNNKNKLSNINIRKLSIILFLIIVFPILVYFIRNWLTYALDSFIYNNVIKLYSNLATNIFIMFTNIWGIYWVILITMILTLYLFYKFWFKKFEIIILLTPIIIYFINLIVKNIVQRPRPEILRLIQETDYSFPSWHTMHSIALYWIVIILSQKLIKNKIIKYIIYLLSTIMIIWIATSRIYLWVHYFTDILWWIILSLLYLLITKEFLETKKVA